MTPRRVLTLAALAATTAIVAVPGAAQAYPERPIELIVPWGAGGGTDATARIIATLLEEDLGQPVNVTNRIGGSGVVGHSAISTADPDGYTLGIMTGEINMMHWMGLTDLTWEDYTLIAFYNADPAGVQVAVDAPWDNVQELLDHIRDNPGELNSSGTGQGGSWHLAIAGMLVEAGIDPDAAPWIPSDGAASALQELVAGNIEIVTSSVVEARALMEAGRIKSLAVMSEERLPAFPDIPTLEEETGIAWSAAAWRAVVGPPGLPQEVVDVLLPAIERVYNREEFIEFMESQGFGLIWMGPEEFTEYARQNNEDFGEVMRAVGLAQ